MVRCNYFIKWVDELGSLHGSWVYLLGSKDSKIKDNFRTWHNVITPQPNKYINLILPHTLMAVNTEIMVLDEVWYLVDYDQNSVPGIVFMSFTETNLNLQRDDLENQIANADQLATWSIQAAETQTVAPKEEIVVSYSILKNGVVEEIATSDVEITVTGNIQLKGGKPYALNEGTGTVTLHYKDVTFTQNILITADDIEDLALMGDEKIKVGLSASYVLDGVGSDEYVTFSVSDTTLATVKVTSNNSCIVQANQKNKLGTFTLTATYKDNSFTKEIQLVSLWQVI